MTANPLPPAVALDPADMVWIDEVADQFEEAWRAGNPPTIAAFLGGAAGPRREALVKELVRVDLACRRRRGDSPMLEHYLREFPELSSLPAESLETLRHEVGGQEVAGCPPRLGDFRILRRLKIGGMGEIYEAVQEPLGRRVAVKVIRQDRFSPELRVRFLREQQILASLHQSHIVPIHAAGTAGQLQFFAMPFIQGASLHYVIEFLKPGPGGPAAKTPSLGELAERLSTVALQAEPTSKVEPQPERTPGEAVPAHLAPQGRGEAKRRLSREYYRSVACFLIDAAEALQHAHDLGILHRDVKPSNLMVDALGHCWIIDFGLAAYLHDAGEKGSLPATWGVNHEPLTGGSRPGTPEYMAPEQWQGGTLDARTDIWGLGATLYELLTLQRVFSGPTLTAVRENVLNAEPTPPTSFVRGLPTDLAKICLKALQKSPEGRYASASEFAEDLRRWLAHEPTSVRRGVVRRFSLWSRNNKGWAAAIAFASAAVVGLAVAAEVRAVATEEREQALARDVIMQKAQAQLLALHRTIGNHSWREEAFASIRQAAQIRVDERLRDEAAAALEGIDGRLAVEAGPFDASSVAFDAAGKRLLVGGVVEDGVARGAKCFDLATNQCRDSKRRGLGPAAFRDEDGTPLQVIVGGRERPTLTLWNIATDKPLRDLELPVERGAGFALSVLEQPLVVLTSNGSFAAACVKLPGDRQTVFAWNAKSGELLWRVERKGPPITALALSTEGAELAIGDSEGQLTVYPLPKGDLQELPRSGRNGIHGLAFGSMPTQQRNKLTEKRLLAVGEAGGNATIWDLDRGIPQAYCYGSCYDVNALAFSPDGATLATGGRGYISLWDVTTGRPLVALKHKDFVSALSFSADGRHLGAGRISVYGRGASGEGGMHVWDLEMGRGIQTLRGLCAPIANVCIAPTVDRIAALSHDWQIGVWNLKSGFLERVLDAPKGILADNAALEISPDGRRVFFAAGSEARLWDLTTGQERAWNLVQRGICDAAAFDASGKSLFYFRVERQAAPRAHRPPGSSGHPDEGHLVGRMRNLLGPTPLVALWDTPAFSSRVYNAEVVRDGTCVVVFSGVDGGESSLQLFDAAQGRELWSLTGGHATFCLDASGKYMAINSVSGRGATLLALPGCRMVDQLERFPNCLAPAATFGAEQGTPGGFALCRRHDKEVIVTLGGSKEVTSVKNQFSTDGKLVAWGNIDCTVNVCNIEELRHELAAFGLAW
ncbi:MAG: serine/threonine-protein kinase [Thermoguttaceae bacterium]